MVLCLQTNKIHDVWSTSLQTEDREYVTASDLVDGNQLVWVTNKKKLAVKVVKRGMQVISLCHCTIKIGLGDSQPKKHFIEDSSSEEEAELSNPRSSQKV